MWQNSKNKIETGLKNLNVTVARVTVVTVAVVTVVIVTYFSENNLTPFRDSRNVLSCVNYDEYDGAIVFPPWGSWQPETYLYYTCVSTLLKNAYDITGFLIIQENTVKTVDFFFLNKKGIKILFNSG